MQLALCQWLRSFLRNQGKGAGNALFVLKLGGEKVGRYDMQMDVPHRFDLRGR